MCLFISHIFLSQVLFLVKAWKYICQQKSHLIRATLSQNKNFIRKTRQTKICLVTVTMHLRGCPYSLWSCNKVLTGRGGRKYLCAQGEMSNQSLFVSVDLLLINEINEMFCYQKYVLNLTRWFKYSWDKFPISDLFCYSIIHITDRQAITKVLKLCLTSQWLTSYNIEPVVTKSMLLLFWSLCTIKLR